MKNIVRFLDFNNLSKLIREDKDFVISFRKTEELKETLDILYSSDTTIEKQIGFKLDYQGEVKTTNNFSELKLGDLILLKEEDSIFVGVIEEV